MFVKAMRNVHKNPRMVSRLFTVALVSFKINLIIRLILLSENRVPLKHLTLLRLNTLQNTISPVEKTYPCSFGESVEEGVGMVAGEANPIRE
jgi:hypothetical protein